MKRLFISLLAIFAAGYTHAQSANKPLILRGVAEYYIKGLSPNGEWAYGTYITYDNDGYGFRWNLRNNKIELLSSDKVTSEPTCISNDGTVVASYKANDVAKNGAYVAAGGFWKDGGWHRYANPIAGYDLLNVYSELALKMRGGISPDGQFMAGTNNYTDVVVWKDGTFDWTSKTGFTSAAYCISPNGKMVGGWSYEPIEKDQRVPVLWEKGKDPVWLKHAPINGSSLYNTCHQFSSNGKWLLYWGGYNETFDDYKMSLYGLYDCEKEETIEIPCMTDYPMNMHYYSVNANGTCVGYENGSYFTGNTDSNGNPEIGADSTYITIYKDGKVSDLRKYLENKGVDFSSLADMDHLNADNGLAISDDERVYTLRYTDTLGGVHPIVVMFDQNVTSRPPVQLEAQRLSGVEGVLLTWVKPLVNASAVKSYKVYRNGQLLANIPADAFRYVDGTVQTGNKYEYTVKAVYADVESEASDVASINFSAVSPQAPIHLFARQSREANAKLFWEVPKSNLTVKNYYNSDDEVTGFGANDLSFECAIRIPEDEMTLYKSQKLTSVNFYPMSKQKGWTVNVYSKDPSTGELKMLYTQPISQTLNYGKSNNVQLETPLALPEGKDIYVAIAIYANENNDSYNVIGEVNGKSISGSTDLLRSIEFNDPDFFSTYEEAAKTGGLSLNTWAIDAVFTPDNAQADIDNVTSYTVYVDGNPVGTSTSHSFETSNLSIGKHTLGVDAVYEDGRQSGTAEVILDVTENPEYYKPASAVYAEPKGEQGIIAHWNVPTDRDASIITYAYGDFSRALAGTESMNFDYRARAEYSSDLFKGYDDYKITALRFYPCGKSDFTLILYADDNIIAEMPVDISELSLYEWNDIQMPHPIEIKQGVKYSMEIDCYDTEKNGAPLAVDNGIQIDNVSNLISTDEGKTYSNLYSNNGNKGNWMMGLKLETDEERPLNIAGFNVVIDNKKVNDELVQGDSYDYVPARTDARSHRLRVDAVYNVKGEVQGSVVIFTFAAGGPEGINDATVAQISVDRNGSQIQVNGADVQSLTLVGMDGKTVASAAGNAIDVTHVQAGSYVLSVKLASGEVKSQKLMVK